MIKQNNLGPKSLAGFKGAPVYAPKLLAIARMVRDRCFGMCGVFMFFQFLLSVTANIKHKKRPVPKHCSAKEC